MNYVYEIANDACKPFLYIATKHIFFANKWIDRFMNMCKFTILIICSFFRYVNETITEMAAVTFMLEKLIY